MVQKQIQCSSEELSLLVASSRQLGPALWLLRSQRARLDRARARVIQQLRKENRIAEPTVGHALQWCLSHGERSRSRKPVLF